MQTTGSVSLFFLEILIVNFLYVIEGRKRKDLHLISSEFTHHEGSHEGSSVPHVGLIQKNKMHGIMLTWSYGFRTGLLIQDRGIWFKGVILDGGLYQWSSRGICAGTSVCDVYINVLDINVR